MSDDLPLRITLLGTGTSHGVPMIACDCPVCTSADPRDRRTRPSVLIEAAGRSILIDTSPELRLQCLASNVRRCDAVLFTHHHIDHVAGLDDLRRFNWLQRGAIPCYGSADTLEHLRRMFPYAVSGQNEQQFAVPQLQFHAISGPFTLFDLRILPIKLLHGTLPVLGFRMGNFAYCTDVSTIPVESWPLLSGLGLLVLDALRIRPHPTHFNLEQAVNAARKIGAKQTLFTHIAHELSHASTNAGLPGDMQLGFDGQVVELN